MAETWPGFVVVGVDSEWLHRWKQVAGTMAVGCRTFPEITTSGRSDRERVVVLIAEPGHCLYRTIEAANAVFPRARIIVSGTDSSQTAAVAAFRGGADDFIPVDADLGECAAILKKHLSLADHPESPPDDHYGLVGDSPTMRDLRSYIGKLAPTSATVLITGETGTGKELAAAQLHRLSRRAKGPLVALNCAAIPETLVEGELFGFERGAFSGALAAYPGKLKLADGGTLFLDEVGELSLASQAKVLRAIETREVYRLGGRSPTRFDVRVIAATNRDLAREKDAGHFREDLFYRLAVAKVRMPPLRDRPADVGVLARRLLQELATSYRWNFPRIDPAALAALEAYTWPGNVRELRNVLEVALIHATNDRIRRSDLSIESDVTPFGSVTRDIAVTRTEEHERGRLREVLASTGGNKSRAAQTLNCSRMTLYRKLARYGLTNETTVPRLDVKAAEPVSPGLLQTL